VLLCRSSLGSSRWLQLFGWALVGGTTVVLLVPAVDIFYQLAQPRPGNPDSQVLSFVAVPVLLLALGIELLRVFRVRPSQRTPTRQ
jgi:hypothetical protein